VFALLAIGLVVFNRTRNHGVAHPAAWDPRVLDIVNFDEKHRGLEFKHPVFIDFLTPDQYSERARSQTDQLSDEDKKVLENQEAELRALGLVTGDVDLFAAENDLADAGTAAFYDPDTERISVRGSDMTVELRVTLAHELTHALQDQYFDVGTTRTSKFETSGEATAFRALVEGDAVRIEDEYIQSLSNDEQSEYFDSNSASIEKAQDQLTDVPGALQAFMAAPYLYGPPFAQILDADGGQKEIDEAFRHPPVDDEQQVDPRQFVHDRGPVDVDKPSLPEGVKDETDSGDLGATEWYLMLAERIPPHDALKATDGWGGDAYVAYEQDGKTCMRLAWKGDSSDDFDEMHDALDRWAAAMPTGAATVRADGDVLRVETCDPGTNAGAANDRSLDALSLIEARSYLTVSGMQQDDLSVDDGFDYAQCVIDKLPFDVVVGVTTSQDTPPDSFYAALDSCT
jgi:Zn-dependent peptidase ImmA (M78 family)